MRVGGAEGDPEGDGRRTLVNGWESRLWRLEDKHLREGSSVRQFGRLRPLRIRHRRRSAHVFGDLPCVYLALQHFCLLVICLTLCLPLWREKNNSSCEPAFKIGGGRSVVRARESS